MFDYPFTFENSCNRSAIYICAVQLIGTIFIIRFFLIRDESFIYRLNRYSYEHSEDSKLPLIRTELNEYSVRLANETQTNYILQHCYTTAVEAFIYFCFTFLVQDIPFEKKKSHSQCIDLIQIRFSIIYAPLDMFVIRVRSLKSIFLP